MATKSKTSLIKRKQLAWLVLSVIGLYVIVPQLGDFSHSWHDLSSPHWGFVGLAVLALILTYFFASTTFVALSIKRLALHEVILVQVAVNFINRLLPAGIGGIGANIQYLRHKGYDVGSSAAIVATNNTLGILGHATIVVVAILFSGDTNKLPKIHPSTVTLAIAIAAVVGLSVAAAIALRRKRVALRSTLKKLKEQLTFFVKNPFRLVLAYVFQMTLTVMNVFALYYSAWAVGINLQIVPALIIFTFGSAVRNFTPTPGGIGGFEASLVAGLVAYSAGSNQALAAILLYRLITYWIPLILGGGAFIYTNKKHLLQS
jgi:uncharacterized protein (TIRG00374 family)